MFISTVLSLPGNCKILNSRGCFANFVAMWTKRKVFVAESQCSGMGEG